MADTKLFTLGRNAYRAGLGLSVGAILYLHQHYLTKESFADYKENQTVLLQEIKERVTRVENIVDDRLPPRRRAESQTDTNTVGTRSTASLN